MENRRSMLQIKYAFTIVAFVPSITILLVP